MTETTATLDQELLSRLDAHAEAKGLSRNEVLREAVESYLDYEDWFKQQVAEGIRAVEENRLHSHAEVLQHFKALGVHVD